MSRELVESIDRLLEHARPGGVAHRRLVKYREQLTRGVFLGPSVLKYIRELAARAGDSSVECAHITGLGKCRKTKLRCEHPDENLACRLYQANRPQTKGNPLGRIER